MQATAWLAALAGAIIASVGCARLQRADLTLDWTPRATRVYDFKDAAVTTYGTCEGGAGAPSSVPSRAARERSLEAKVRLVVGDPVEGRSPVQVDVFQAATVVDGKSEEVSTATLHAHVDRLGSVTGSERYVPGNRPDMFESMVELVGFPTSAPKSVGVGDSWNVAYDEPSQLNGVMQHVEAKSHLVRLESNDARPLAVVESEYEAPVSATFNGPAPDDYGLPSGSILHIETTGRTQGQTTTWIDLDEHVVYRQSADRISEADSILEPVGWSCHSTGKEHYDRTIADRK